MKTRSASKKRLVKARAFLARYPWIVLATQFALIFAMFLVICVYRLDLDFGWHLQAGNYIRAHGIPEHDIFTYTAPNFPWINHEWGNDVITSFLYQYGGYFLAALLFSALWTLALFINGRHSFKLLFLAALAMTPFAGIRPIAWTVLLLALLLRLCAPNSRFPKFLIPLIFIFWANVHAGFIIGLIYLSYLAITKRSKTWAWVLLASVLATFINGYGPRLYVEVARTLTDGSLHSQVTEWKPLIFLNLPPVYPYMVVWLAGFCIFSRKKLYNWVRFDSLLFVSALSSARNVPLFVTSSLNETEAYLKQATGMIPNKLERPQRMVLGGIIVIFLVLVGWGVNWEFKPYALALQSRANPMVFRENSFPGPQIAYLKQHPCNGNIFNDYNYGGYLIWKLPNKQVFIDGRMPSWKAPNGTKYLDTYFKTISDKNTRQAEFKRYNISCVLVRNNNSDKKMISQLQASGWRLAMQANGAVLLVNSQKM